MLGATPGLPPQRPDVPAPGVPGDADEVPEVTSEGVIRLPGMQGRA